MWKDIQGYKGIYQISSAGQVRSLDRITSHGHKRNGGLLKLEVDPYGYFRVGLTKNGKQKRFLVSRLVAIHFLPNPHKKRTVNHKDGRKLNNRVSNLEWATTKEQSQHAIQLGLINPKGSGNSNSKLTENDVRKIKSLLAQKLTIKVIAKQFDVSWGLIGLIKQERIWRHV